MDAKERIEKRKAEKCLLVKTIDFSVILPDRATCRLHGVVCVGMGTWRLGAEMPGRYPAILLQLEYRELFSVGFGVSYTSVS